MTRSVGARYVGWVFVAVSMVVGWVSFAQVSAKLDRSETSAASKTTASGLPEMRFDVASIRPSSSDDHMMFAPGGSAESFRAGMATVESMIGFAYQIPTGLGMSADPAHFFIPHPTNIIGAPDWVDNDRYDLAAKVDTETMDAWSKLPKDVQQEELRSMVRALLADRFHLVVRHETREQPVYALVVAKGGPKFAESVVQPVDGKDGSDHNSPKPYQSPWKLGRGSIEGHGVTIESMTGLLWWQREIGSRKILDRTGLIGKYDLSVKWASVDDTGDADGPSLFTAMQEQLGLKLESTKAPADVLVIEHIERPTAN